MTQESEHKKMVEDMWRTFLTIGDEPNQLQYRRHLFRRVPSSPRCQSCNAPFRGIGGALMKVILDKRPSRLNPRVCNICDNFASQYQGGAEIQLTLLFADVRGSTSLAEGMSTADFSKLINRFYNAVSKVLIRTDALIDKLIGDQVTGIYVPGFAGEMHSLRAVTAAQEILRVTGHNDPDGPWIPLGAGVHTGVAFIGSVGSQDGTTDITVLGDVANTAARLPSSARQGEILISEAACTAAELDTGTMENRVLELKGKSKLVPVCVLTDYTSVSSKDSVAN